MSCVICILKIKYDFSPMCSVNGMYKFILNFYKRKAMEGKGYAYLHIPSILEIMFIVCMILNMIKPDMHAIKTMA